MGEADAVTIALESDFLDCYDHWFERRERARRIWIRHTARGPVRRAAIREMERAGLAVPEHGTVRELERRLGGEAGLVVYVDEGAHRGEGKRRMRAADAMRAYAGHYATRFVESAALGGRAVSLRYLQIGGLCWWLRYEGRGGADVWMSNAAPEVEVTLLGNAQPAERVGYEALAGRYPLFAVDHVLDGARLLAVDLNTAPQIRGTGVERMVRPRCLHAEVVAALEALPAAVPGPGSEMGVRAGGEERR